MDLKNEIIPFWVVLYDKDADLSYIMNDREQLYRSIDGALSHYVHDDIIAEVKDRVRKSISRKFIPISYSDSGGHKHTLDILRIDLDGQTKIHQLFSRVLDTIDHIKEADLAIEVLDLFVDPERLTTPPQSDP